MNKNFEKTRKFMIYKRLYKYCEEPGCGTVRSFGYKTETHCDLHKKIDMKRIIHTFCDKIGCNRSKTFTGIGRRMHIYCKDHINTKNTICKMPYCKKVKSFGFPESKWEFCSTHKQEGMVNLRISIKKSNKCIGFGCNKRKTYGFPGKRLSACSVHRTSGMLRRKYKSHECIEIGCKVKRHYGFDVALYCRNHSSSMMKNVYLK